MTERHDVTNQVMGELVSDQHVFGGWQAGNANQPALVLESVHHLKKWVAGRPLARPWWWFDPAISGEAIADVGTHLADLAIGFIAPSQAVDYRSDIRLLDADRWPLILSEEQFRLMTMLPGYPEELRSRVVEGQLYYAGNSAATLLIRGVHVKLSTTWEFEAPAGGGDIHHAVAHGMTARVAVRQQQGRRPELFVEAVNAANHAEMIRILQVKCSELQARFPGLTLDVRGTEVRLVIPDKLHTGHESHFAAVMEEYIRYFQTPRTVPHWERPNLLAKYYITTRAVEMSRQKRPGL